MASLARPGGNVTGTWTLFEELIPKWLEIIDTAVPDARAVAVLANPESVDDEYWWTQIQHSAKQGRGSVARAEASSDVALERAFAAMKERRADAVLTMADAYKIRATTLTEETGLRPKVLFAARMTAAGSERLASALGRF